MKQRTRSIRKVLQVLRRESTKTTTSIPSVEVIESWSKDFNNLLNNKYGLMLFRSFLLSEYSEENIDFWIACEEYKTLKLKHLALKSQIIFSHFMAAHAPEEVNLDCKTRTEVMKSLTNPTKDIFDIAQYKIQCLMEKDSYNRFLESSYYTDVLTQARVSSTNILKWFQYLPH